MKVDEADVPARAPSLAEQAFDRIEEMIVSRKLAPGAMLSESQLIDELSIGRTPIREALARLEWFGLVEIHSRRGVLVSSIDVIRHLELLEVRLPLEHAIVRHMIERATAADIDELKALERELSVAAKKQDRERYFRAKRALHECEVRSSYNPVLTQTMRGLHAQSRRFWMAYEPPERFTEASALHARIVSSICARDRAAAVTAVEELFAFLVDMTKQVLNRRGPAAIV